MLNADAAAGGVFKLSSKPEMKIPNDFTVHPIEEALNKKFIL